MGVKIKVEVRPVLFSGHGAIFEISAESLPNVTGAHLHTARVREGEREGDREGGRDRERERERER